VNATSGRRATINGARITIVTVGRRVLATVVFITVFFGTVIIIGTIYGCVGATTRLVTAINGTLVIVIANDGSVDTTSIIIAGVSRASVAVVAVDVLEKASSIFITRVIGTLTEVIANYRCVIASRRFVTGTSGAFISIIVRTTDGSVCASQCRVARITRAFVVVIAVYVLVLATVNGATRVISTGVVVIARNRGVDTTGGLVASISGTSGTIIANYRGIYAS